MSTPTPRNRVPGEWQPIETAPKYLRILLFRHFPFIGSVCHDGQCLRDRDNVQMGDSLVKATHWMPLPEPPVTT